MAILNIKLVIYMKGEEFKRNEKINNFSSRIFITLVGNYLLHDLNLSSINILYL